LFKALAFLPFVSDFTIKNGNDLFELGDFLGSLFLGYCVLCLSGLVNRFDFGQLGIVRLMPHFV
jgi:hypothetical protein